MAFLALLIPVAIKLSIALIVFATGLKAAPGDAAYLFRRPEKFLRSILAMNVAMLVVATAAALLLDLEPATKIALVVLALSPAPPILPGKLAQAGASASYGLGLLVGAAVATLVLIPVALQLLEWLFHQDYRTPFSQLALVLFVTVLGPLGAGLIVRSIAPAVAERMSRPIAVFATLLLAVAALPLLYPLWPQVKAMVGNGTIITLVMFSVIGLAIGHVLGGPEEHDRSVLALATAARHPGVALAIAGINFPNEKAVLAVVVLHLIVSGIVTFPYVRWRAGQ